MTMSPPSSSRTPKGWPHGIEFITQPRYAAHLPVAIRKHLQGDGKSTPAAAPCPLVSIRRISVEGHPAHGQAGLFATRKIAANAYILDYMGEVHTDVRDASNYDLSLVRLPAAQFGGSGGTDSEWISVGVDAARCGNEARFVNDYRGVTPHANAVFKETRTTSGESRISVWSGPRGIRAADEILISYGKGFWTARTQHAQAASTTAEVSAKSVRILWNAVRPSAVYKLWPFYCAAPSPCNRNDWPHHKTTCTKVVRMDLNRLHVYLACLAYSLRENGVHMHPALSRTVVHCSLLSAKPIPDGNVQATTLGDPLPRQKLGRLADWFPNAPDNFRQRLWNRISSECDALTLHLSVAVGLLSQLYPLSKVGIELAGSAVIDYGVAFGAVPAIPRQCMMYLIDGLRIGGQQPTRHAWLYFTNANGQTATLDLCMNPFDCGLMVSTTGFWTGDTESQPRHVPVVWRPDDKGDWYTEFRRLSVLHDERLLRAAEIIAGLNDGSMMPDAETIKQQEIAPRIDDFVLDLTAYRMNAESLKILLGWAMQSSMQLSEVIHESRWHRWPDQWQVAFDYNPDDDDDCTKLAKEFDAGKPAAVTRVCLYPARLQSQEHLS